MKGGRRHRRKGRSAKKTHKKGARKGSDWQQKVMQVYRELKAKNSGVRLMDAMKEASRRKKKGQL
jgi:hypothetical protein